MGNSSDPLSNKRSNEGDAVEILRPTLFQRELEKIVERERNALSGITDEDQDSDVEALQSVEIPMIDEIEALYEKLKNLDEKNRELLRNHVKLNNPKLWKAVEYYLKVKSDQTHARLEVSKIKMRRLREEHEKAHQMMDEAISNVTDSLLQQLEGLLQKKEL